MDRELNARCLRYHLWISQFTATLSASALLLLSILLLYSFCSTTLSVNNDHVALAIPNQLQKNRNNDIGSLTPSVKPVNHHPISNVGPNQIVNENTTVMLVGVAIDPDPNDKLSYLWTQIEGPAVTLNGHDTASPTFTAPSNIPSDTQLKFALTAKDNKGAASDKPAIVTITVKHINHHPIANAGTDQTADPGYIVTLDGTESKDPDSGDILSYSWVQTAGPTVILNGANSPIATFTAPSNISADTTLVFKLTVTDSKNGIGTANVKVTDKYIAPPNQSPVADAGTDRTVNGGDMVNLDGTESKDPDGTIQSYSWKQLGGPSVTLNGANTATATFTAPSNISTNTVLAFGLTVTDSKNATDVSAVRITVNPVNHPPIANAGQDQTVNAGYVTTLDGSKSNDPDNDPLTYSWKQTGGSAVTLNGADSAIATFIAPKDITSDTDMTFQLTVTDSKNAANTSTVKVTDKYTPPPNQAPVANAGIDQTAHSGDTVSLDGSSSSDPNGNVTSYSWIQTSGPAIALNGSNTANPSFTAPTLSNDTTLKFSLTVKDDKGVTSNDPAIVSVTVKASVPPPSSSPSIIPSVSNQTGNATSMTTRENNQTNNATANGYSFKTKWGSYGTADGQFKAPYSVAVDSSGNVYVADFVYSRIQKFDGNGTFITKWGSYGTADGQFEGPADVAVDPSDHVYVADDDNDRVQKFDGNGTFITKWGSNGTADGQFQRPFGVAVDSSDHVYVADVGNHRIQKFDGNGTFITKWGSNGTADGQFDDPSAVAVDSSGNVYVAETCCIYRIQKFDGNGTFITKWGSKGTADGQFDGPEGVAVDSSGNVYVADSSGYGGINDRVQKFDGNGNFITKWGSKGTADGQFDGPEGVAVDSSGNVYVADSFNSRVQVFSPSS